MYIRNTPPQRYIFANTRHLCVGGSLSLILKTNLSSFGPRCFRTRFLLLHHPPSTFVSSIHCKLSVGGVCDWLGWVEKRPTNLYSWSCIFKDLCLVEVNKRELKHSNYILMLLRPIKGRLWMAEYRNGYPAFEHPQPSSTSLVLLWISDYLLNIPPSPLQTSLSL